MSRPLTEADRDLIGHLMSMMHEVPPASRQTGYWIMSRAWWEELKRRFADEWNPELSSLFGLPVKIDAGAGFPAFVVPPRDPDQDVWDYLDGKVPPHQHTCSISGQEIHDRLMEYLTGGGR